MTCPYCHGEHEAGRYWQHTITEPHQRWLKRSFLAQRKLLDRLDSVYVEAEKYQQDRRTGQGRLFE